MLCLIVSNSNDPPTFAACWHKELLCLLACIQSVSNTFAPKNDSIPEALNGRLSTRLPTANNSPAKIRLPTYLNRTCHNYFSQRTPQNCTVIGHRSVGRNRLKVYQGINKRAVLAKSAFMLAFVICLENHSGKFRS